MTTERVERFQKELKQRERVIRRDLPPILESGRNAMSFLTALERSKVFGTYFGLETDSTRRIRVYRSVQRESDGEVYLKINLDKEGNILFGLGDDSEHKPDKEGVVDEGEYSFYLGDHLN